MELETFKAISHPFRKHVIESLADGTLHSTESLVTEFSMTKAAVSQHLKILRDAQLVTEIKIGRTKSYGLNPTGIQDVLQWAESFQDFWMTKLRDLNTYLENTHGKD